jgi:hypothetical protein
MPEPLEIAIAQGYPQIGQYPPRQYAFGTFHYLPIMSELLLT